MFNPNILLASPSKGAAPDNIAPLSQSYMMLQLSKKKWLGGLNMPVGSGIWKNRESIFEYLSENKQYTHVLTFDNDIVVHSEAATELINRAVEGNYDILGASVIIQQPGNPTPNTRTLDGKTMMSVNDDRTPKDTIEEAAATGLCFTLISRKVVEAIPTPRFEVLYGHTAPDKYTGEDYYFCHKARKYGFKIMIDHKVSNMIYHRGPINWGHHMVDPERFAHEHES